MRSLFIVALHIRCLRYETHVGLNVKCPIFLCDFKQIRSFETDFHKNSPIPNLTKFRPVGAALLHVDRLTGGQT
jgi:hypothetical protein